MQRRCTFYSCMSHLTFVADPAQARFSGEEAAVQAVRAALHIRDPGASKNFKYKNGEWDGYHDFRSPLDLNAVPTGLLPWLLSRPAIAKLGPAVEWVDGYDPADLRDAPGVDPDVLANVTLRDYQIDIVGKILRLRRGVVSAPPRSGKTEVMWAVVRTLELPSLMLVNRTKLAEQHLERATLRGVDAQIVGSGRSKKIRKNHVVATVQSLHNGIKSGNPDILALLERTQVIQADEAHFVSDSTQWIETMLACRAPIRVGFSGTPFHANATWNAKDFWLRACTGPLIAEVAVEHLIETGVLLAPSIYVVPGPGPRWLLDKNNWFLLYGKGIVNNNELNRLIADLAVAGAQGGRRVLVLVAQLKHGENILKLIAERNTAAVFASGNDRVVECRDGRVAPLPINDEELKAQWEQGTFSVLIGSTVFDQGLDLPFLDTVILGGGWRSPIHAVQRAFRCMTSAGGKRNPIIVDFKHSFSFVLGAHTKRRITEFTSLLPNHAPKETDAGLLCSLLRRPS